MRTLLAVMLCLSGVLGLSGATVSVAGASGEPVVTTKVPRAGISIDVARAWGTRDTAPRELGANVKKLQRTDPKLAKLLRQGNASGAFTNSLLIAIKTSNGDTLNVMPLDRTMSLDDIKA